MELTQDMHQSSKEALVRAGLLAAGLLAVPTTLLFATGQHRMLDGLSWAVGALTLVVAFVVAAFSLRYMRADRRPRNYFATIGLLIGSVLVFLFTRNLLVFALAWCASGVLLGRLIGHCSDWAEAGAASRRTALSFAIGDAALLAGLGLLGGEAGSLQLDVVLAAAGAMPGHLVTIAAMLLLVAATARCALPPFAGWLLSSMTAPTPVSALMHAGMVNAGGFLLIRFAPVFEAAPAARIVAVVLGLAAAIYGVGIMAVRPDIKRSLAGSTVSQMGFMIMSCGLGAYAAALWHILAHGLFKAWLFLGSGSTIGMRIGKRPVALGVQVPLAIAGVTLVIALGLTLAGRINGSALPLLLGISTAAAMLAGSLSGTLAVRTRLTLVLMVAALTAFHVLGQGLVAASLGPDAPAILPDWVLITLLSGFLAVWVWQQQRLSQSLPLPPALYVHLLNAGALNMAAKGVLK